MSEDPRRLRIPAAVTLIWAAGAMIALAAALCALEIDARATAEAGRANARHLWPFWLAGASLWAALTAMWWALARSTSCPFTALLGGTRRSALCILAGAAAVRLIVLLGATAELSDDVYRYVFDGRNLAAGDNPYLIRPEDRLDADPRWTGEIELVRLINNPELHTLYLPLSQWVFAGTALLIPERLSSPDAAARVFRAALTLCELGAIALLLVLLVRCGRSVWWAALYAWHPLAITEIAGSGHQEGLGLMLLVLALLLFTIRPRRIALWTAPLAAAALVKPVVVPLAALMLRGRRWTGWLGSGVVGAAVGLAIAAPLWLAESGRPIEHLRETGTRFTLKWAHFGSVYEPLLRAIEQMTPDWTNDPQEQLARAICGVLVALAVGLILVSRISIWRGAQLILLAMVLLSPAAHPWYLLWALIVAPLAVSRAVWLASLTLPWGYVAWRYVPGDDGNLSWGVPPAVMVIAYAPVYAALVWDLRSGAPDPGGRSPGCT